MGFVTRILLFRYQAKSLVEGFGIIFARRRRLIDSLIKHDEMISSVVPLLSLPGYVARKCVEKGICRLTGKPYRDHLYPSVVPDMLTEWRNKLNLSREQAAARLGITVRKYYSYEQGYREPSMEFWETVKPHLFEARVW
jgi:hypothetical protein